MNRKFYIATICLAGLITSSRAQNDTSSTHSLQLDEFVYSANKFKENKKNIAQPIHIITSKESKWAMQQTTAGLLEQTGSVFMQRSQAGGGSAAMRGFEASRLLMIVDGVRMNNAIYRAGHLQNIITIDNNILDNVEVLFGPASTMYGSDALGGVIIFNTVQPKLSSSGKMEVGANLMTRYSSANNEGTGHIDLNLGFKKIAALTSITYSKFDDLRQGSYRNPLLPDFGTRKEYVTRVNGVDSIVKNPDPNVQKQSGYNQVDILEKILYKQNSHVSHGLNLQYSNSSDIPRYDRLTDLRNGKLRYAEWYYGPQKRMMASYNLHATDLSGFFDEISANLNYQSIEESRHQRTRGSNMRQSRIENLDVMGYAVDLRKKMNKHELIIGTDGQYNNVRSTAHQRDIVADTTATLDTRYPDGGSTMYYGAVYAQHFFKIIENKLVLNDGIRLNYVNLHSVFNDTTFYPFPFKDATQQTTAWSGNLGIIAMPSERWRFALNGSTGFRSPNVDDMAKVFESAGGVYLAVPNPNLKPEYTYNLDLGITYRANNILKLEANGFYTWFKDAIVQDKFTLNGKDSTMYDGKMTAVVASQNKAKAYIYGFTGALTANLSPNVTLYTVINFTYGRYHTAKGGLVPLDHIAPVFGKTSIMYNEKSFTGEVFVLYNGRKRLQDYSPSGEDNLVYATAQGMPAWYTLNVRAGYKFNKYIGVQLALENILDYNYRVFASGISAPGRNFVVTLRGSL